MEIKEYWQILKQDRKVFIITVLAIIALTFGYFIFRPVAYETSLLLNITRTGTQIADAYKFDNFYRLQADEKYAETIVEWLKSPRTADDIYQEAKIGTADLSLNQLSKVFQADKLSSQIVSVKFATADEKNAKDISAAIIKVINKNTQDLNAEQKDATWFEIVTRDPVIVKKGYSAGLVLVASLFSGLFLAFWLVMFRHFLK